MTRRRRGDLVAALDAAQAASDPEADAVVDDALDVDSADEAEASVEATDDEETLRGDESGEEPESHRTRRPSRPS